MKTHFNFFIFVFFSIAVVSLSGMDSCNWKDTEEDIEARPTAFIQSTPPNGSTIQADTTIIADFDNTSTGLNVTGGDFSVSGDRSTITGLFPPGTLNLVLTWSDSSKTLTYTVETPDGMVFIRSGDFEMGSDDKNASFDEQPVHTVYVDAFYMDKYEVTNLEFKSFLLENPLWQKDRVRERYNSPEYLLFWNGNDYGDADDHPVICVNWYAAMAYARWSGKRLPTEAEWEKAARGGLVGKKYPNGDTITLDEANFVSLFRDRTTPVGSYPPNAYGLYDMAGNASEWCLDEYDWDFYSISPRENPLSGVGNLEWIMDNFTNVSKNARVLRGGSWYYIDFYVRVSTRIDREPTKADDLLGTGFRCAMDILP